MKNLVSPKLLFRSLGGSWKEKGAKESQIDQSSDGRAEESSAGPPESQTAMHARVQRQKATPPGKTSPGVELSGQAQDHQRPPAAANSQSLPQMPVSHPSQSEQSKPKKQMIVWPVELVRQKLPTWSPPNSGNGKALDDSQDAAVGGCGQREEEEDGWLGIEFQPRVDGHLIITKIVEGGPADGTKSVMIGDIIVGIRGFFARALTPLQIKELTKGYPGTKLSLTLGSEFLRGHSYTMEHCLLGGEKVHVARVKVVNVKPSQPVRMEPEEGVMSAAGVFGSAEDSMCAGGRESREMQGDEMDCKEFSEAMTVAAAVSLTDEDGALHDDRTEEDGGRLPDDITEDGVSSSGSPRQRQHEAPHPTPVKGGHSD